MQMQFAFVFAVVVAFSFDTEFATQEGGEKKIKNEMQPIRNESICPEFGQ